MLEAELDLEVESSEICIKYEDIVLKKVTFVEVRVVKVFGEINENNMLEIEEVLLNNMEKIELENEIFDEELFKKCFEKEKEFKNKDLKVQEIFEKRNFLELYINECLIYIEENLKFYF